MSDEWVAKFLRGLTIGALMGAVVAGSRVWTRWGLKVPARVAALVPGRSGDVAEPGDLITPSFGETPNVTETAGVASPSDQGSGSPTAR